MVDVSGDLVVTRLLTIPAGELRWRFSGSGGPGGQHANTSNTKVTLIWNLEESAVLTDYQRRRLVSELGPVVRIVATDERSQTRNRDIALDRLRERVRAGLAVRTRRRATTPTRSSVDRRLAAKRLRSELKSERRADQAPED
ncbi:MAG: alternative ribosome rescue aminoacyl-tRNA hydrolase ArfB [Acidimicrobiales bacterium]|jgi:ribosome-associated protein